MKRKMVLRLFSLLMAVALVLTLAACGTSSPPSDPSGTAVVQEAAATSMLPAEKKPLEVIDLVLGWYNGTDSSTDKFYPSAVMQDMMDKLAINLSITGYSDEKLNLALASGDMPDLMLVNNKFIKQIVEGGLAVALDEYLDTYGQNIQRNTTRNEIIRQYYSNGTGKLYFHTPNAGLDNPSGGTALWNGYILRWDLYKQIGAPRINNDDEYIATLQKMKELYSQTENGDPVYGMGVHNDWGLWGWLIRSISNFGYNNTSNWGYVQNSKTNDLINNFVEDNSPFWNDMTFYWKLNQAGLLDPDSFTMKWDEVQGKAAKGQYLGTYCTWVTDPYYDAMKETDPSTTKGMMAIPFEGSQGWYGSNWVAGWTDKCLFITSNCANIERAVSFIDYQDTHEANRIYYSGFENTHWKVVDGVAAISPETIALKSAGGDEWARTGIGGGGWANIIGYSGGSPAADGQPYDLFTDNRVSMIAALNPLQKDFCNHYQVELPVDVHKNMVKNGKAMDKRDELPNIAACMPPIPDDISTIDGRCTEIVTKAIPKIVLAADASGFDAARATLLADLKAAGADESWTWWQENWNAGRNYIVGLLSR